MSHETMPPIPADMLEFAEQELAANQATRQAETAELEAEEARISAQQEEAANAARAEIWYGEPGMVSDETLSSVRDYASQRPVAKDIVQPQTENVAYKTLDESLGIDRLAESTSNKGAETVHSAQDQTAEVADLEQKYDSLDTAALAKALGTANFHNDTSSINAIENVIDRRVGSLESDKHKKLLLEKIGKGVKARTTQLQTDFKSKFGANVRGVEAGVEDAAPALAAETPAPAESTVDDEAQKQADTLAKAESEEAAEEQDRKDQPLAEQAEDEEHAEAFVAAKETPAAVADSESPAHSWWPIAPVALPNLRPAVPATVVDGAAEPATAYLNREENRSKLNATSARELAEVLREEGSLTPEQAASLYSLIEIADDEQSATVLVNGEVKPLNTEDALRIRDLATAFEPLQRATFPESVWDDSFSNYLREMIQRLEAPTYVPTPAEYDRLQFDRDNIEVGHNDRGGRTFKLINHPEIPVSAALAMRFKALSGDPTRWLLDDAAKVSLEAGIRSNFAVTDDARPVTYGTGPGQPNHNEELWKYGFTKDQQNLLKAYQKSLVEEALARGDYTERDRLKSAPLQEFILDFMAQAPARIELSDHIKQQLEPKAKAQPVAEKPQKLSRTRSVASRAITGARNAKDNFIGPIKDEDDGAEVFQPVVQTPESADLVAAGEVSTPEPTQESLATAPERRTRVPRRVRESRIVIEGLRQAAELGRRTKDGVRAAAPVAATAFLAGALRGQPGIDQLQQDEINRRSRQRF